MNIYLQKLRQKPIYKRERTIIINRNRNIDINIEIKIETKKKHRWKYRRKKHRQKPKKEIYKTLYSTSNCKSSKDDQPANAQATSKL